MFTDGFDSWWPASHHIGGQDDFTGIIEPRVGGRWFERGADGTECDWGRVVTWEPPARVVLDWQINSTWNFDPTLHTKVEVRFVPAGDGRTRVEVEHGDLEAFGEQAPAIRETFDSPSGWRGLLGAFSAAAAT